MTMRHKIEETTADFLESVALPAAERVRQSADELIDRLGTDARHLGERVGERVSTQLADLPEAAMKRFDLVPAKKARRRTILGMLAGVSVGMLLAYFFNPDDGKERRQSLMTRLGIGAPEEAAAITGDLPK